jgi:bifunctional ADP-heptose synthase (sugar kinase/adenylyltransferase)
MPSDKRQRKAVVVVGDVMIDRYVTGKVERISLEATCSGSASQP